MTPDEIFRSIAKASGATSVTASLPKTLGSLKAGEALTTKVTKLMEGFTPSPILSAKLPTTSIAGPSSALAHVVPRRAIISQATGEQISKALLSASGPTISASLPKSIGTLEASEALTAKVTKILEDYEPAPILSAKVTKLMEGFAPGPILSAKFPAATLTRPNLGTAPVVISPAEIADDEDRLTSSGGRSKVLPEEVGELLATGLVRVDREAVMLLLTDVGLEDARLHLEAIEERLLHGTRPAHLHAALSASILLRDLANRLFPARSGEFWVSRFESKHPLDSQHVGNRLAAFVDFRLRSRLSTKEHRLFQATLDAVLDWAGEGHHVIRDPRSSAHSFRQLLEVLAMVARAHTAPGD